MKLSSCFALGYKLTYNNEGDMDGVNVAFIQLKACSLDNVPDMSDPIQCGAYHAGKEMAPDVIRNY